MDKFYIDNGTVLIYHRGNFKEEEEEAARVAATAQNKIENGESFSLHEWVPV